VLPVPIEPLKRIVNQLKQELEVYRRVLKHKRTPLIAKLALGLAIGYLLLPFDVIPDWIPLLGYHRQDAYTVARSTISWSFPCSYSLHLDLSRQRSSRNAGKRH
jgi:uncharacterized membrane protein YkvA (DUF1232 family)